MGTRFENTEYSITAFFMYRTCLLSGHTAQAVTSLNHQEQRYSPIDMVEEFIRA